MLDVVAYTKPAARHVLLGPHSEHPASIHRNWPLAEMSRMHRLCSNLRASRYARGRRIDRFRRFFLSPEVIEKCTAWRPSAPVGAVRREPCPDVLRLLLRFHRTRRNLSVRIRALLQPWLEPRVSLGAELGGASIQLAFRAAGAGLAVLARAPFFFCELA